MNSRQTAGVIQTVLPIYFDFRISVAQTKPVDKDDKQSIQDSKNDFTLKLFCDQTEVSVQTDDLETLQGLLRELRKSHLIARKDNEAALTDNSTTTKQANHEAMEQDDNFYAGGSTHRWIQYYTTEEDIRVPGQESVMTMDEFIASNSNPLAMYFLQPEDSQPSFPSAGPRLKLGSVKESWVEKEMRSRESAFTEYGYIHAFVGTWNVNGRNPTGNLDSWLKVEGAVQPDIYVIWLVSVLLCAYIINGAIHHATMLILIAFLCRKKLSFQELDLRTEAYIVLDGAKEEEWTQVISESLGSNYHKIMSKQLVGLLIIMYVAEAHVKYIKEVTAHSAGVGIMGVLGNKGGVAIRIRYKDSYLCFVDSHLAHDTSQVERRNQDYQEICRRLTFPSANPYDITKSPAGNAALGIASRMVSLFESDHTIWAGDLNYRIALPEDQVKSYASARNYDALLKHDQLNTQRSLSKAFAEFEEPPITFQPTFKYDVGTDTWDSSEKRRVPAYTDRVLYRSTKGQAKDHVETLFYKSHMELKISDHKPVSAMFKLKVKTLLHDKQAEVHQAIVRELDRYENECMPDATISSFNVVFDEVRYLEPKKNHVIIKNTGQFPAQYRFKPKLQDEGFCKPWIWANPPVAMIMPGESAKIHLTVMVNNESAPLLNTGRETMEDILILHLEHGKDYFISVSGSYIRTCFGNSLEWLSRLDRPIRLWDPAEDDDDDEEMYGNYNALGNKSSMGSIRDSTVAAQGVSSTDASRQVKNVKSLDGLSETSVTTGLTKIRTTTEKKPSAKKSPAVRQLSLPKDLWRIVDFIYKYGFSVDNLFLLSGDQSTMSYIRECLDTGEEFDLTRLLDKPSSQEGAAAGSAKKSNDDVTTSKQQKSTKDEEGNVQTNDASNAAPPLPPRAPVSPTSSTALSSRGSVSDLKPQIARPVSIMNGIPPKAANFGSGENRGIHSMAEVLLRFLESLRESVVPTEMYYKALEIAGHQQAAYGLLDLMPPVHVNVFVYITSFLRELILVGGSQNSAQGSTSGKDSGSSNSGGSTSATNSNRVLQSGSGSIYNGVDPSNSSSGRVKRDDEDYRVAKLASVFASVMLRPPPGAERISEPEAIRRKMFMMQFLQEPVEDEGLGGSAGLGSAPSPPPPSSGSIAAVAAAASAAVLSAQSASTAASEYDGHDP
ncbi:hypothetical protein BGX34_011996 [Mortierella sp. NVP85]|nr:hypothetical protein BGX34_011996 [Mortierella sp. NVP85]